MGELGVTSQHLNLTTTRLKAQNHAAIFIPNDLPDRTRREDLGLESDKSQTNFIFFFFDCSMSRVLKIPPLSTPSLLTPYHHPHHRSINNTTLYHRQRRRGDDLGHRLAQWRIQGTIISLQNNTLASLQMTLQRKRMTNAAKDKRRPRTGGGSEAQRKRLNMFTTHHTQHRQGRDEE